MYVFFALTCLVSVFFCLCTEEILMRVVLNGKETEIGDGLTVAAFLESREIAAESVVVELNRKIVPSESFDKVTLNDGDHLEVLRFVGGG